MSIIVTPEEIKDYGDRVNGWALETNTQTADQYGKSLGKTPSHETFHLWVTWFGRWTLWWVNKRDSWYDRTWGGTYDDVAAWHAELEQWRATLAGEGVQFARAIPDPPKPEPLVELDLGTGAALVGGGVVLGAWLLSKWMGGRR